MGRRAAALILLLTLGACAAAPIPLSTPGAALPPSAPIAAERVPLYESTAPAGSAFAELPGWASDDHAAALRAFAESCQVSPDADLAVACGKARAMGAAAEAAARAFFERSFRPELVAATGVLTGYFSPLYEARSTRQGAFTAPVRPRPGDLPRRGSAAGGYPDRVVIEARPVADAVAWMRPEDLFVLQTQGSGTLVFADGARRRAISDGTNGARFVGIAGPMQAMGLLAEAHASAQAVHDWLAANRGDAAKRMMDLNPRYVFFRLGPDGGGEPAGAAGAPLPAGRAVAVDPAAHPYGELLWIDAEDPGLAGARPSYRRLVIALDRGGAIHGPARADLYLGRGESAGEEAGRIRHRLLLWRLRPIAPRRVSLAP